MKLVAKVLVTFSIIASIGGLIAVAIPVKLESSIGLSAEELQSGDHRRKLIGNWRGTERLRFTTNDELTLSGLTCFNADGGYTFSGDVIIPSEDAPATKVFVSRVETAGKWRLDGADLSVSMDYVQTIKTWVREEGKAHVDHDNESMRNGNARFRLERYVTLGAVQEYSLNTLTAQHLAAHATGDDGTKVTYIADREP
ncbi:hypothetical protein [Variovorax paradoxus]|uniref:hypothetical protein n=1 Tax=Variovorax paradoxus TaxID=34073 RepID=UPI003D652AA6